MAKGPRLLFLHKILCLSGKKVGLYTSPHLIRFNERIRINGKSISDYDVATFLKIFIIKLSKLNQPFLRSLLRWPFITLISIKLTSLLLKLA